MKKITKITKYFLLSVTFFIASCQKEKVAINNNEPVIKPIHYKKVKGIPGEIRKKGIEHMADYQFEIRKAINAENSTYKSGYLLEEFKKAKQNQSLRKSPSSITPVFNERGPVNVPGRTRGIAVDPNNKNRWFVGSVGGGVWLTEDDGLTWRNLTDFQLPNLATSTIVISPQDSNTLYVGTGEPFGNLDAIGGSGLFKTTNGGVTWSAIATTSSFGAVGKIIINPSDKNNVLAATTKGIFRTTDGGTSWTQTYVSSNWVQDLDADPSDFNIQYGSVNRVGLVKSTNGGQSWTLVFNKNSFNANHSRFETSVSPADPNTVFMSVYSGSNATTGINTDFYVSRNKGASFTNLKTTGTAASANLVTDQGWYDNVIMAHPFNSNVFYVGGVAVFKVTVSGSNFSSIPVASGYDNTKPNSYVHVDQHGLEYVLGSGTNFKIILANDGGVYSTSLKTDPGITEGDWSTASIGKNSTQFYGATKQNGQNNYIAGAQDNGTWISFGNDASKSKSYLSILGGDGFEVIWHYTKPGSFIATSQFNFIGRFVNNAGALANFSESGNSSVSPFYSKIANADNNPDAVFCITTSGVWRSTDFAGTWNLTPITNGFIPSFSSTLNVKVSTADPNVVWAGGAMSEDGFVSLHVSEDNGETFRMTSTYDNPKSFHNYDISGLATSPTERNRAYALFSGQGAAKVIKTEDLGATWTDISGYGGFTKTGFPDVAVHSIIEMPFDKNILWVGTDIGIFETLNGGASWTILNNFIPVAVYDMKIVNDQVVIATHGRGIWSATLTELANYTLPAFLSTPEISSSQKQIESLKTLVNYSVTSDDVNRVKIFIDGIEQPEIIQDFNTGISYQYETQDLSEGIHKIGIQLFVDATNSKTTIKEHEFHVINFYNPSTTVGISVFKTTDVYVFENSFGVNTMNNRVTNEVLNNEGHPYENNKVYSTVLKKPLIISEANKNFTYEDMAITEPFTDNLADLNSFYDFVLIEASTDLKTWKTLDKYDSRRFPEWLTEFNKGANASANDNLFKSQTIVLTNKGFSIGQTVVFRFSLITDPGATSFGWAIKSIEGATASIDDVLKDKKAFTVYPTISNGDFTIFAKNTLGKSTLKIYDVRGKEVYSRKIDFKSSEKNKISVTLGSGVYLLNLIDENNKRTSTKIIIQ